MTTYISSMPVITMFPESSLIHCSPLTPELVRRRMEKVQAVSTLDASHDWDVINAIERRYGIELSRCNEARQIRLATGDELFIVQATLPRLADPLYQHTDETIQSAPISFRRWRVPVRVDLRAPSTIPQHDFDGILDGAHAIALWQRGADRLKSCEKIIADLEGEIGELEAAESPVDAWLEASDIFYKACCAFYVENGDSEFILDNDGYLGCRARTAMLSAGIYGTDLPTVIDVALAKHGRRANGEGRDLAVERELVRSLIRRR